MKITDLEASSGIEQLKAIMNGYQAYQVLSTALELKMFDWLENKGSARQEEITAGLGINGMFGRSFLQALVDMKLLLKTGDVYANSPMASSILISSGLGYQGDWFRNTGSKVSKWSDLTDTLTAQEPSMMGFADGPSREFLRAIAQRALHGELQAATKAIRAWEGFSRAGSLIDIGGGHGLYAIALCQTHPGLQAVVFDKPHVIGLADEFIAHYALTERISTQGGDAMSDPLGSGFDIAIIAHLLYKFRKQLPEFFRKLNASVKSGGIVVSNHWFCDPGCDRGEEGAGVRDLERAVQSFGHPLCHGEEFDALFKQNGFRIIHKAEIPSAYGTSRLHIALKK
ncbi:methyltransferase [Desulfosporosinus sp. PR]|uniref:methyltransferase n=1 Tax=Candidatus Desulfosporosinus nitrosoreducens TaxID=3401928 RepID=UPI0027FBDD5F|nr:methyltransferase [Desulfosporosinus sp. PR]MDQ7095679.1 methyltransferase [Desulfosporosinus sp. PR]